MIDASAALQRVREGIDRNPVAQVHPLRAIGQVLAEDVVSGEALPPFDNSAMDGFALPAGSRVFAAGRRFEVRGEQAAGDAARSASVACEIMTGACVPQGLGRVVPVEQVRALARDVQGRPTRIELLTEVAPGQHVRRAGADVPIGAQILSAGVRLDRRHVPMLAGVGCHQVATVVAPSLALICTGREIVDGDGVPAPGQVRNSIAPYLARATADAGARLLDCVTVSDDVDALVSAVAAAAEAGAQVIVTTGGVSMGRHDIVPEAVRAIGAEVEFHTLRMRPGKPLLFARLPGGRRFFGLPGNPSSAAVGFRFFVCAALRAMLGLAPEKPLWLPLRQSVIKSRGMTLFEKARVEVDAEAALQVRSLPGQESFRVRPLAEANAWAVLPASSEFVPAGTRVEVYGLDHWGLSLDESATA